MRIFFLLIICVSTTDSSTGVGKLLSLLDTNFAPTSLIEHHLSESRTAANSKKKRKFVDKDCDGVVSEIDSIERTCSSYRWKLLKAFIPQLTEVFGNHSALLTNISLTNKTMFGDPLAIEANEVTYYGLSKFISLQSKLLYGGLVPGKGPNTGSMINWRGLAPHVGKIANLTGRFSEFTIAVLDTEWSNMIRIFSALADYVEQYNVDDYVVGLSAAMADGVEKQKDMLRFFRGELGDSLAIANDWMRNISILSNNFQTGYMNRMDKMKLKFKQMSDRQVADMNKANDKLVSVTDYLGVDAPGKYDQAVYTFTQTGVSKLQEFKEKSTKAIRERMDGLNDKWKSLVRAFKLDNGDNIVLQDKSLGNSESDRRKNLAKTFREFTRNTTNVVASMRLDDAQDIALITDTTTNMTNSILDFTFASQDAITKVQDQAGKLKDRVSDNTRDLRGDLDNLLQELTDGTGNQQEKISEFLKMAADSNANELASLVASAANMRLSLGDNQTAAQAAVDSLIAQLQSKLATKAKEESNVSYQVQSALQVGRDISFAKLKAAKDALDSNNDAAISDMDDAAGGVLEWVQDASAASDKYAQVHRDFLKVLSTSSDAFSDEADISDASASLGLSKLISLANSAGRTSSRSAADAAEAARAILTTLKQVRSGSISVNQVTILRDGSLRDKLSKIAAQLGMSDDSVGNMFSNLVSSLSSDANSQISNVLTQQLTSAKNIGLKLNSKIDSSQTSLDDLNQETEMTDERSLQLNNDFKSQLSKLASNLDQSFSSATDRDNAIRRAVYVGLDQTRQSMMNQAKKAVTAVTDSRRSLVATVTDQAETDIQSFGQKARSLAKSQFDKVSNAFENMGKAKTDRTRLSNALSRESTYFSQFLDGAWKSANEKHLLVDKADTVFTEFAKPSNSTFTNMSSDITELDKMKHVLIEMQNAVGQKIENSIKVIQDSFLMTDNQLLEKSKMLKSLANASMTDEERAALESEAANLEKSRSIMKTYETVQSQALAQIFQHNSGLLGDASGTVGNLQDIANSVSGMLNSNDKVNAIIDQGLKASGLDAETMMNQMASAITGTSTSIQQMITSNNTQNGFSNNITSAQMNSFLNSAKKDSDLANQVASDLTSSSSAAISKKQALLAQYAAMLHENQAKLSVTSENVLSYMNQSESNFSTAIKANQADQAVQLILVKNAVQQLLQLWSQYAAQQGRKFTRWNSTESQFYNSFTRELESKGSSVFSQYSVAGNGFNQTQNMFDSAVKNFTAFLDHVTAVKSAVHDAAVNLNVSTQHSASQLGERIYQVDVNDRSIDDEGRAAVTEQLNATKNAIAQQMDEIVNSFKVGKKTSSSYVELGDSETVSDDYLTSLESEVDTLENQIYDGRLTDA